MSCKVSRLRILCAGEDGRLRELGEAEWFGHDASGWMCCFRRLMLYNPIVVFTTNDDFVILYDARSVRWGVLCMRVSKPQLCRWGAGLHIGCRHLSFDILEDEERMTSKEMHRHVNRA